jgi:(p)ppGpp synthase/HD superfamily hydrolase
MYPYAQTNIQLFNQLRHAGYSQMELRLVRDAYELAMELFTGRFLPSGKSFVAHVVGTASILASLRLPAPVVTAGLLHNIYNAGDFGDGRHGTSTARRRKMRRVLGPEVETYAARFPKLYWQSQTIQLAREDPDKLDAIDRNSLLILLADHLEHLEDCDVFYYDRTTARRYIDNSKIGAEIAGRLGFSQLATEMREAIRKTEFAEIPVTPPEHRDRNGAFVIAPASCRKRISVALRQNLIDAARHYRRKLRKAIKAVYERSPKTVKRALVKWAGRANRSGVVWK